ncbi:MAG: tRNA preQ1(34) S-adenosylmethionine ribosyltransferase-isomerase QueA [Candidatus Schekmanbacteria bacterium]|nr:tRNA preQ1(34) S-adenosylmethionine ribosyltransferase-isomerase QueA [Candidatus Schekmanbacteria bacterium]
MKLSAFDYHLPPELIAQAPAPQREQSRLLVLNRDNRQLEHTIFDRIGAYLPPNSLLVLNNTKVIPARLSGRKSQTSGKLELLLVHRADFSDTWEVMVKGKVKAGTRFHIKNKLGGEFLSQTTSGHWLVKFQYAGDWESLLEELGQVPLPPYIKGARFDDKQRYQTVYAILPGAVAAPTAGLHFTQDLLERLQNMGIELAWVTLHVGPGTFAPVKVENIADHKMGAEFYFIPLKAQEQIKQAKQAGRKIITVGTTATRTLESAADETGMITQPEGWTNIFIYPGYCFRLIDGMITNFHLPASTPLIMTCALAGRPIIMQAYQEAIKRRYRFYSYGDAMLIL